METNTDTQKKGKKEEKDGAKKIRLYKICSNNPQDPCFTNMGDCLSFPILTKFGIAVSSEHSFDMVGIGSALDNTGTVKKPIHIWTTGIMSEAARVDLSKHKVWGLRGKLSLDRVSGVKNKDKIVLGDGGLLARHVASTWPTPPAEKKYTLGIVPHYVDHETLSSNSKYRWLAQNPDVLIVKVNEREPSVIVDEIATCKCIISSSLHGLIVADSLRIPNRRFVVETSTEIAGKGFKFRDYYSVYKGLDMKSVQPIDLSVVGKQSTKNDTGTTNGNSENKELELLCNDISSKWGRTNLEEIIDAMTLVLSAMRNEFGDNPEPKLA